MSFDAKRTYNVPDQTAQVARAIFPKGNPVMRLHDDLHMVVEDRDFADLFPTRGRPAEAPVRLALATLLQFMDGLTDRQAADAVRTRIDWKYLLCLVTDVGFDHAVLSEFRTRLLAHGAEGRLFEAILELARGRGLLKGGGRQRNDSTHVLGAMRTMSRLEVVGETLRHALNALATAAPDWLRAHTTPAWVDRYGLRASEFRLPKSEAGRRAWAKQTGVDGFTLLALATADGAPPALRDAAALETLRQVWIQNFLLTEHGPEGPQVDWRANDQVPPSGRYIGSPYDAEARYATKGATVWSGYKVHLTETCDNGTPNLITNVETTNAAVSDDAVTAAIHAALDARGLLPTTHVADTGFVNSALFVDARERYGVDLIGPTRGDRQWQAQAGAGFAARDFAIDFAQQRATCPAGKVSQSWTPALARGTTPVIKIKFSVADCRSCPLRPQCTRSTSMRRAITIRPEAQHEALRIGRARERTAEFAVEYARRAGIEGTIAQGVRSARLRRTPCFGHAKTHLAHLMTAAAMNLVRLLRWLADEPQAQTRHRGFARLHPLTA